MTLNCILRVTAVVVLCWPALLLTTYFQNFIIIFILAVHAEDFTFPMESLDINYIHVLKE